MEADNIIILWVLLWFMQVCKEWLCMFAVAFCEEAVDWNISRFAFSRYIFVAFCEEAVDWNLWSDYKPVSGGRSLSARKLWIEIAYCASHTHHTPRRFLRGSCGLKFRMVDNCESLEGRFLRGSCGLKFGRRGYLIYIIRAFYQTRGFARLPIRIVYLLDAMKKKYYY